MVTVDLLTCAKDTEQEILLQQLYRVVENF